MSFEEKPVVALARCRDYEEERVAAAVHASLEMIGGMQKYVRPGEKVFLKINLLAPFKIERAVTSHPAVVRAMVKEIQAAGGSVTIGDSPGGPFTVGLLKRVYRAAGVDQVAEETGASLNYNVDTIDLAHPEGKILKRITVMKAIAEADAVITLPKLKTHGLTVFTGAVKILFGVIPGLLKAEYHLKMPEVRDFSEMLVDILTLIKPRLTVMDGIVGMEGDGPSAGTPRSVGLVLASADSVACDVVGASVIGIKPEQVTTTRSAMDRGISTGLLSDVVLAGPALEEVKLDNFQLATKGFMGDRLPKPLYHLLKRSLRSKPVVRPELCSACGTCVNVCPPKVVVLQGRLPVTDYEKCIRCFCCQELCPQSAIAIWRPWLARWLMR